LLEAAVSRANTDTIFSSTNESNIAMRALFERDGWTLSGVLNGIDEGDPEMVFWRRVPE
jgi:glycogen synthase